MTASTIANTSFPNVTDADFILRPHFGQASADVDTCVPQSGQGWSAAIGVFLFLPQFGQLRSVAGIGCPHPEHFSVIPVS
jgi:hypothetical protein